MAIMPLKINNMTATEWLFLQLYEKFEMKGDGREMDKVLEQAKAMEKNSYICEKCGHENMQQMQGEEIS